MKILHDWVLIELEPEKNVTKSGIVLAGPQPVRIAKVLEAGPGKWYGKRFVKTEVKKGDRFPFFKAATDTKNGKMLAERLPDNQELVRETDILFVMDGSELEVSL